MARATPKARLTSPALLTLHQGLKIEERSQTEPSLGITPGGRVGATAAALRGRLHGYCQGIADFSGC